MIKQTTTMVFKSSTTTTEAVILKTSQFDDEIRNHQQQNQQQQHVIKTAILTNTDNLIYIKIVSGLICGLVAASIFICALLYVINRMKRPRLNNRNLNIVNEHTNEATCFDLSNTNTNSNNNCTNLGNHNNDKFFIDLYRDLNEQQYDCDDDCDAKLTQICIKKPSVLIVYTMDCQQHFNVVRSFAYFLNEVCKFDVYFDIWEEQSIKLIGLENWLDNSINIVDYVVIIWSIGARIKCNQRSMSMTPATATTITLLNNNANNNSYDNCYLFEYAIEIILKNIKNFNKNNETDSNSCLDKYINVYFEYSTKCDISYKFDLLNSYQLMFDLNLFLKQIYKNLTYKQIFNYLKLNDFKNNNCKQERTSVSSKNVSRGSSSGSIDNCNNAAKLDYLSKKLQFIEDLEAQIVDAKNYFKLNPNWFENELLLMSNNENLFMYDESNMSLSSLNQQQLQQSSKSSIASVSSTSSISSSSQISTHSQQQESYHNHNSSIRRQLSSSSLSSCAASIKNTTSTTNKHKKFKYKNQNDFFMHPLPSKIDDNYFNLLELKLNNTPANTNKFSLQNKNNYENAADIKLLSSLSNMDSSSATSLNKINSIFLSPTYNDNPLKLRNN